MNDYRYYYRDNWHGTKKTFKTLCDAKKSAKKEYGVSVALYDNTKKNTFNKKGKFIRFLDCSGFTPA